MLRHDAASLNFEISGFQDLRSSGFYWCSSERARFCALVSHIFKNQILKSSNPEILKFERRAPLL
jgi:hypothetical protein